jgi:hypothetical protein
MYVPAVLHKQSWNELLVKYEEPGREQNLSNCHVEMKVTKQPTDDDYAGQVH